MAVQGFANVETLGGYRPVSLFALTIARSGERKSTVDRCLSGDLDAYGRSVSEPTTDSFFRVLKDIPSAALLSDEAGAFLGGYALRSNHAQRTFATLNSLWGGKQITKARAKDTITLRNRRLSVHLAAQPGVMHKLLADPMAEGIGFLPRCLIVEPQSTIGNRVVAQPSAEADLDAFHARLDALLSTDLPVSDPDTGDLDLRKLPLSPAARAVLMRSAQVFEAGQAPGGQLETVTAFASKAAEQACRIAGVLTLWQDEAAAEVSENDMKHGIALSIYYIKEAQRLMGLSSVDGDLRLADKLLTWLRLQPCKQFVSGLVMQNAPSREMRNRATAERLLSILADHNCIRRLPKGTVIDGKVRSSGWTLC